MRTITWTACCSFSISARFAGISSSARSENARRPVTGKETNPRFVRVVSRLGALACALGLLLSASPRASMQVAAPAPAPSTLETYVRFGEDLFQPEDIILRGVAITHVINFTRPTEWKMLDGSELRLVIEHSPELMAQRSTLTIAVN